jgi:hypothetical protein
MVFELGVVKFEVKKSCYFDMPVLGLLNYCKFLFNAIKTFFESKTTQKPKLCESEKTFSYFRIWK